MKLKLNRKTITICSLVLILFVVGYAYNAFISSRYKTFDLDFDDDVSMDWESASDDAIPSDSKGSLSIIESQKEEGLAKESSTFFTEYRMERDK
ncbi:MAG: hypothetical protein GX154_04995, partial [Clostridiales bacterium]|nr:hypothetical protein [Clostridiales bacterium]